MCSGVLHAKKAKPGVCRAAMLYFPNASQLQGKSIRIFMNSDVVLETLVGIICNEILDCSIYLMMRERKPLGCQSHIEASVLAHGSIIISIIFIASQQIAR